MPKSRPWHPSHPTERVVPPLTARLGAVPGQPGPSWRPASSAIGVYFLLPPNAQSVFYVVIGFASVVAIFVGTMRYLPHGERLAWHLFALGLLCQVAGDAIFAVYELSLNREPPSPSVADVFYLGGYPLLALGIFLVLRRLGGQTSRAAILDSLVIFAGVVLFQWVFFIEPYRHMSFGGETQRWVAMAYPVMDVLLLVGLAQLLLGPGGQNDRLPAAAPQRRPLGRRGRDLRPEHQHVPGRRLDRRALARLVRRLGRGRAPSVDGAPGAARPPQAAASHVGAPGPARGGAPDRAGDLGLRARPRHAHARRT